jgi:hypothetical protein
MMDRTECAWCSNEIDDGGLLYKNMIFCCEDCRGEWEEDNITPEDIVLSDLDEDTMTGGAIIEDDLELDEELGAFDSEF